MISFTNFNVFVNISAVVTLGQPPSCMRSLCPPNVCLYTNFIQNANTIARFCTINNIPLELQYNESCSESIAMKGRSIA
jgi:hypothetical protein